METADTPDMQAGERVDRNLVLTGFMGTGKSTVGKLLAARLSMPFVDSDEEIVARTGMSIPVMFEKFGEPGFRQVESVLCKWLASRKGIVISTGGGMLVNLHNLAVMAASGLVVCLTATPEVLETRLRGDAPADRPLAGQWRELLDMRQTAYAAIPNQIDTSHKTPEAVAAEVLALWQSSR